VSLEGNHLIGRDWGVIGASGHVPVRYSDDRTRPVITDRTRSRVRSEYSKLLARSDASGHVPVRYSDDRTRPVITDRTRSRVRSEYSKLLARSDASGHP
jgi:hypothetical protein